MSDDDGQLPDEEIARRMERGLRRALSTPPQLHGKNPKTPRATGGQKVPKTRKTDEYQAFVARSIERFPQPSLRPVGAFREDLESELRET
jgi:hypothetical protein